MPKTLYLIDGHALAYRTYFALTSGGTNTTRWNTSKGEPTAGVFGFASVLLRIFEQEQPDYLAVAFDVGKTFRDEIFPDYKGTREKMPDDLRSQIERMRELVDTFNLPRLEMQGYEADDVLGSVAKAVAKQGLGVKIITGDRDLLQLVDKRIIVSLPGKKLAESTDYDEAKVVEALGVRPDQVVDYKALVGDTSDNIPGVKGVGKKTAEKLLAEYETLDGVYEHIEELAAGQQKKLATDKDNAYLSQKLALIVTDLEVDIDLEQARPSAFEPQAVQELFRELEFRSLMPRLATVMEQIGMAPSDGGQQLPMFAGEATDDEEAPAIDTEWAVIDTQESLDELVKELNAAEVIAFDTETTGTDKMQADIVGISVATEPKKGYYIPVGHDEGQQLPLDMVIDALRKPMTNKKIPKAGHNLKYDYVMLRRYGLDTEPLGFDSMLAEYLRDPGSRNLGLKNLSWVRLDVQMIEIEELIGKGKKQVTMAQVPIEKAAPYAAADAEIVLRLKPLLEKDLEDVGAVDLFHKLEMPLIKVLSEMEVEGISLDTKFLSKMSGELDKRMGEITAQVYAAVGEEFNLNSTQQLSKALFETLKIAPPEGTRKTASGFYSTSASVLETLKDEHEVVQWILEYRELSKLASTYVDALPQQVNPATGRVHTSYQQHGSVTGRIASSDPNLQNIPIRTELGRKVRHGFVAEPGKLLLGVDYSQVELRIVAHMADDKAMLDAFKADQDIHATTAAAIYDIDLEEVTSEQRRHAKAVNFGLIYGMSAFGLTRNTDLTLGEAENFVSAYFERFPGVAQYLDESRKQANEQEFVETLMGRRRYFHGLKNQTNYNLRGRMEREAINSPIQGTAADIMKQAMLDLHKALQKSDLQAKMLLQVHDEIVLECPEEEVQETAQLVQEKMSKAFKLEVPLRTDARAGINWGTMTPVEG
ncbi:MAG: DNA polymerase I [Chloroflexi bacterium]|nr:MAG: DNA polymerase I [Chloroflexota bacterium]MBL1195680.1 DNA polymerase I [Chloroflexota bacterium]NOH12968.1 DNA polymerase I [Chloroflexota bacterium]